MKRILFVCNHNAGGCAYISPHDRELGQRSVVELTIERVSYHAEAVADEVRSAGLPGEFADKLLVAA